MQGDKKRISRTSPDVTTSFLDCILQHALANLLGFWCISSCVTVCKLAEDSVTNKSSLERGYRARHWHLKQYWVVKALQSWHAPHASQSQNMVRQLESEGWIIATAMTYQ